MKIRNTDLSRVIENVIANHYHPNFFVTGESCVNREKTGLEILNEVCSKKAIDFKGVERFFTIRLPYCACIKDINAFLSNLRDSISIAQDCYDVFKGIVMIELDSEWGTCEHNACIQLLFDYIKMKREICFVVLFPGTMEQDYCTSFYHEISDCGYWILAEAESPTVEYCVKYFEEETHKMGYTINEDIFDVLRMILEKRSQKHTDNLKAVEQLVKRITFERKVMNISETEILKEDILCLSGQQNSKVRIGFGADSR